MRALPDPFLCVISDDGLTNDELIAAVAGCCTEASAVQLRVREAGGAHVLALAEQLRTITRTCGCLLLVNDRIDVALAVDADGLHLPAAGFASERARGLLGANRWLGRSVHSLEEIEREKALGAVDYLQFGPVFATPSKAAYGRPQGLDQLARAAALARPLPLIAIGGITRENVADTIGAGAAGVAVITAVMRAEDPCASARELVSLVATARNVH